MDIFEKHGLNENMIKALPEYVKEEIEVFLLSKDRYHEVSNLENIQQMKNDYHYAYLSIKSCVVNGVIGPTQMDELVSVLRRY